MSNEVSDEQPPGLNLGGFQWEPVPTGKRTRFARRPQSLGVLDLLQGKVFAGKGFNTIFRPRSKHPLDNQPVPGAPNSDNDLELNLTHETLTFTGPIGDIPNRGFSTQPDILLGGITYIQSIQDVTNTQTGGDDGTPVDIHLEPGVWVVIPPSPNAGVDKPTLCRMASIPHGTTINAQGVQPSLNAQAGKPNIPAVDITPTVIATGSKVPKFPNQTSANKTNRIPLDLDLFNQKSTITDHILSDPNVVLRNAIHNQDIENFITFDITTLPTPFTGGGTANIAFLGGRGGTATTGGPSENAFAASMKATFWIETVRWNLSVAGGQSQQTSQRPAGDFGPTFVFPPTTDRTGTTHVSVTSTQLQYSQEVLLQFNTLNWPHVSVATLGDTSEIKVELPPP